MPYVPHTKIVARGSLGAAGAVRETWSCGLNLSNGAATWTQEGMNLLAHDAFADWSTFITNSAGKVSMIVSLDEVKTYSVKADGLTEDAIGISDQAPVRGVAIGHYHPWQVTNVVTLVADGRSPGKFGRIYLPPQVFTMIAPEGRVSDEDFASMFTAVQTLLTDISNLPGLDAGAGLVVASRVGLGSNKPVAQVRMGHIPDTQRRRRRSLEEGYTSVAFTP